MTPTAQHLPASGSVRGFAQASDFSAALLGGDFEYLPMPGEAFSGTLRRLRVEDAVVQHAETTSHTARGAIAPGLAALILPLSYAAAPARMNGAEVIGGHAFLAPAGVEFQGHCPAGTAWAALSLSLPHIEALAELAPLPVRWRGEASILALPPGPAARLARVLGEAGRMAEASPQDLARPGCAAGLAMSLREAVDAALTAEARLLPRPRASRQAERVVRAAEEFLRARIGQPVYREQLCASLCVSLRTLHNAFVASTGLSPLTYLKVRRLSLARRALGTAGAVRPLVKSVALAHGFWHLGYFARDYRALFGEAPSRTVERAGEGLRAGAEGGEEAA